MKRIPIQKRKVSTTVALSPVALSKLEIICEDMGRNRSFIVEDAIDLYYRFFQQYGPDKDDWIVEDPLPPELPDDIPDDVSEIGYNPYTGSYEEDL